VPVGRCRVPLLDVFWRRVGTPDLVDGRGDSGFDGDLGRDGATRLLLLTRVNWLSSTRLFGNLRLDELGKLAKRLLPAQIAGFGRDGGRQAGLLDLDLGADGNGP
jgi:hypothetical protein